MNDRTHNRTGNGGEPLGSHLTPDQQTAYLDGELTTDDRARLSAHLDVCPQCVRDVADLRATITLLSVLPSYRTKRSFQLSEAQAQTSGSWWQRLGFRLLPALPALRTATVAAALLLVVVSVGDLLWDESGTANVVRQSTTEETFAPSTSTTLARTPTEPSEPTQAKTAATMASTGTSEPTSGARANQLPPTQTPTAAPIDTEADTSGDTGTDDSAVAQTSQTNEPEPTDGASGGEGAPAEAAAASGTGADAPVPEAEATEQSDESEEATGNAAGARAAEPPQSDTGANTEAGDGDSETLSIAAASEESPRSEEGSNGAEGFAPAPDATPFPNPTLTPTPIKTATISPASPSAMVASPTVPSDTAAESESVNTSTDDGVSGWRIAQITMAVTLLLLAVVVVALTRLRRQQTVGMKLGTYFGQATFTKYS